MQFAWNFRKHLIRFTGCMCILVIVFTCAMWPRSLRFQERVAYTTRHLYFAVRTNPGTLTFELDQYPISPFAKGWHAWHDPWSPQTTNFGSIWGGVGLHREEFIIDAHGQESVPPPYFVTLSKVPPVNTGWTLDLPFWLIALAAVHPLLWMGLRTIRSRARVADNHCRLCGYDLRATPLRCPECGTEPAPQPAAG